MAPGVRFLLKTVVVSTVQMATNTAWDHNVVATEERPATRRIKLPCSSMASTLPATTYWDGYTLLPALGCKRIPSLKCRWPFQMGLHLLRPSGNQRGHRHRNVPPASGRTGGATIARTVEPSSVWLPGQRGGSVEFYRVKGGTVHEYHCMVRVSMISFFPTSLQYAPKRMDSWGRRPTASCSLRVC